MINKLIICFCVLLVGCENEKDVSISRNQDAEYKNIIMYGDSLCAENNSAADKLSIMKNCKSGRKLVDGFDFNQDYNYIILALGTNDIIKQTDIKRFTEKASYLAAKSDLCILPNINQKKDSEMYIDALSNVCEAYLSPVDDCAVSIGNPDGVHYIEQDYIALSECIKNKLIIDGAI